MTREVHLNPGEDVIVYGEQLAVSGRLRAHAGRSVMYIRGGNKPA